MPQHWRAFMPRTCSHSFVVLCLTALVLLVIAPCDAVASKESSDGEPLNIVLLYADDWRHDTLGCAGNSVVQTPHLDQMAQQGVRFSHNCVTTSICWVSRASLLTGQWMSRHGKTRPNQSIDFWEETYPAQLRSRGYYVGHVGKWNNGPFPKDQYDFGRAYGGSHWLKQKDGTEIHVTRKNEMDAIEFLRSRPENRPFCLTVSFFATHAEDHHPDQYRPQPESMSLYQDVVIPTPVTGTPDHFQRLPKFIANEKNEGRNRWHWRFDAPEKFQVMMKNYYRMVTEVDAVCGRIVEELKQQGVLEKTLVIFTTDNGNFHGEHQLADKWYPYEESIRVPLIVIDPRIPQQRRGAVLDQFTLNVDLAPTIVSAAGLTPPARMQGRDFSELYRSETLVPWREEFFYEHPTVRDSSFIPSSQALVRRDWKYIYWPEFDTEELYHVAEDPHEERNRISDPDLTAPLQELRKRFAERKLEAALPAQ